MSIRMILAIIMLSLLIVSCGISDEKEGNQDNNSDITEICTHGDERDVKCGLNNRGLKHEDCFEGKWISNYECVDPDVCIDGTTDDKTCGVLGTSTHTCVEGQWQIGQCEDDYLKPDGKIPEKSKGSYLYFSAKKIDDKYNSDLYMIDLTEVEPTVVQLTDTAKIDEISPSAPADNSFLIYGNGYYEDPSFSKIRYVELDASGRPKAETDKKIIGLQKETCNSGYTSIYLGKGNPYVSLDGSEIVFVDTYEYDEDDFGCAKLAFRPARAFLDSDGNVDTIERPGWDAGPNPGRTKSVPISPVYLRDTKRIVVSWKGIDQHPVSSEIQVCDEACESADDWWFLTYQAVWSMDNVAQVSIGASITADEIIFFRSFAGDEFDTGIYSAGNILDAEPHTTYGPYGVLTTDEKFISGFGTEYISSTYRALALSPDSKLIAVALTFIDNEIKNERHSNIAILDRETGEVVKTFEFSDSPLREVDGLHWR